ncbi:ABC transporter permease [Virgibacillus sp. W0430]|uniref:ABC transporter permease n=1 Tax=Virgibacillus sp. W0430 TaxID=3391580 RepID=UPI003F47886D
MFSYLIHRIIWLIPVFFGVSILIFVGMRLAPGDPAQLLLGSYATEESLANLRAEMGLDASIFTQYFIWLSDIVTLDFGRSITYNEEVLTLVLSKIVATAYLAVGSLLIAIPIGMIIGIISAVKQNTWIDRLLILFPLTGISLPIFWLGMLLIIIFSGMLEWFPSSGIYSPDGGGMLDLLYHLVLPAITLSLVPASVIARMMRSSMLEVIRQDYIRTARAKGAKAKRVILIHVLRNALIPVVTVIGMQIGYVIGGAVVVEVVFSWPGIGQMLMNAILTRDYPLVIGGTLILALIFALVNLVVDLLYSIIDPRIQTK